VSSLRQKTISGVLWSGSAKLILQLVLFIITTILARLLSKDDFGVVGMAAIITVAINMVNDKGLGMAIVQRKNVSRDQLATMFWGSLAFGALLYLISVAAAVPLALFFRKEIVAPVVIIIALGFIVGGFGIVQKALMTRDMEFKNLSIIEIVAVLLGGTVAVIMALLGFGVWSLVANSLLRDIFNVIGLWIVCRWRPHRHFSWREFRDYLGFSSKVLANDGATYLITNVDVTIIGRILGSAALGVYNLSLYLVKLPVTRISAIVAKVVFPAFAAVQDNTEKFKRAYLRAMKFISVITFPALAGLAVFSHEFIAIAFGEKWQDMAMPLIILTPMSMLKSVGTIRGSVLMAVGRPQVELYWNLIYLLPLIGVVYAGTFYGINGVAAAYTVLYVVTFPIIQYLTDKPLAIRMREFIASIFYSSAATVVMVAVGLGVRYLTVKYLNPGPLIILLSGVVVSTMVFISTLWILDKQVFADLRAIFKSPAMPADSVISEAMIPE
jgi:O-antigen/teichoic acid export membrane protein